MNKIKLLQGGLLTVTFTFLLTIISSDISAAEYFAVPEVPCVSPPPVHCPEANCPGEITSNLGNAIESESGRQFFLDYPCDLQPGEKVTFVLNLHGGGSISNWQRHYFPVMDLKEKYRLVVASPSGIVRAWVADNDDAHLQAIVRQVYATFGEENIAAFWLAGHSQGGQTSNRLVCNEFYRERIDGWVSLSGGRLGSKREDIRAPIPRGSVAPANAPAAAPAGAPPGGGTPGLVADASILPDCEFSHIYSSGSHEVPVDKPFPDHSPWAAKLGCDTRQRQANVVDTAAGYVFDSREQENRNAVWGLDPGPGHAEVYVYPDCDNGRIVADIIRMDKGHTEGLEPRVTEEIVRLMISAQ
ncbi:MAG: alpha/beta hydrolase [Pseudohongiellaceae bacterium]